MQASDSLELLLKRLHNANSMAATVQSDWGKRYWTEVAQKLREKVDRFFDSK
jgi:hypothetical protein